MRSRGGPRVARRAAVLEVDLDGLAQGREPVERGVTAGRGDVLEELGEAGLHRVVRRLEGLAAGSGDLELDAAAVAVDLAAPHPAPGFQAVQYAGERGPADRGLPGQLVRPLRCARDEPEHPELGER